MQTSKPRRKDYPLVIETISSDVSWSYFSRGHHDLNAFAEALAQYEDGYTVKPSAFVAEKMHKWLRGRVCNPHTGYSYWYDEVPEGTPRAFPVTLIEDDDIESNLHITKDTPDAL